VWHWLLEQAQERLKARRWPLTIKDCVFHGDDPEEPCWGAVTCWEHNAADHPGCESLCHGHRACHPGNDFTGSYRLEESL